MPSDMLSLIFLGNARRNDAGRNFGILLSDIRGARSEAEANASMFQVFCLTGTGTDKAGKTRSRPVIDKSTSNRPCL